MQGVKEVFGLAVYIARWWNRDRDLQALVPLLDKLVDAIRNVSPSQLEEPSSKQEEKMGRRD